MYTNLILNASLLIASASLFSFFSRVPQLGKRLIHILTGVLFGGVAIAGMALPYQYAVGIQYDGRSIILAIVGLFGGGLAATISMVLAGAFRLYLGGNGVWAGLATVLGCGVVGLVFRSRFNNHPEKMGIAALYGLGLAAHVVMLLCQLLLQPWPSGLEVIRTIWIPIILVFPLATMLLGVFFGNEERFAISKEDLKKSTNLYQDLIETAQDLIWQCDTEGRYTYLNPAWVQVFGYTVEEMLGKRFTDFQSPDYAERDMAAFATIMSGHILQGWETVHLAKDGRAIRLIFNAKPLFDLQGAPGGTRGTAYDISRQYQVNDALRENEKRFREIVENASDLIYNTDPKGYITYANPSIRSLFGYYENEGIGEHYLTFVHPEHREDVKQIFRQQYLNKIPTLYSETPVITKDGRDLWLGQNSTAIFKNGKIKGYQIVSRDITTRKKMEIALRESEKRYREIVEGASDLIYKADAKGIITYVNPPISHVLGYSPAEAVGMHYLDFVSPEHREQVARKFLSQFVRKTPVTHTEVLVRTKDGRDTWLAQNANLIIEDDEIRGFQVLSRDITEQKRAEKALLASENELHVILESTADGILAVDKTGKVIKTNKRFTEMWHIPQVLIEGRDDNALLAFVLDQLLDPDQFLAKVRELYNSTAEDQDTLRFKDGRVFERFSMPLSMEVPTSGRVWSFRDVTDRTQAETVREILLDIMMGGVTTKLLHDFLKLVHRSISKVMYAENFFVILYDKSSSLFEEIYMVDKFDLPGPPSKMEKSLSAYVFRTGKPLLLENETVFDELVAQGEVELIGTNSPSWLGVPLKTSRKTIGVMVMQDYQTPKRYSERDMVILESIAAQVALVIERKRAENEISLLANALKGIKECVCITDPGNTFLFVNESFLTTYGYREDEVIGKNVSILRSKRNPPEVGETIHAMTLRGGWYGELWNKRKDGSEFLISLSTTMIHDTDGSALGLIGIAVDVTAQKQAEEELIAAKEQAEKANELKDAFIANISHEIRTPLNIILGYTDIIEDTFAKEASDNEHVFFERVHDGSERLMRTVDLILNTTRARMGDITIYPVELDLTAFIGKVIRDFTPRAQAKSLELRFNNTVGDCMMFADQYILSQVLVNLLDNAIKYTNEGEINVDLYHSEPHVYLDVRDTGIGMTEQFMEELFKPYSQEHTGYTRGYEGIGLGMSLVKQYLALHDIPISVKSEKGKGSTFTLCLSGCVKQ